MNRKNRRIAVAAATTVTAVAVFGAVGGVGLAGGVASLHQYGPGPGQYQYSHKVTICHKGKHTIRVSERAWPAHRRHGDTVGTCAEAKKHAKKALKAAAAAKAMSGGKHGKKAEQGSQTVIAPSGSSSGKSAGHGGNDHAGKNKD